MADLSRNCALKAVSILQGATDLNVHEGQHICLYNGKKYLLQLIGMARTC